LRNISPRKSLLSRGGMFVSAGLLFPNPKGRSPVTLLILTFFRKCPHLSTTFPPLRPLLLSLRPHPGFSPGHISWSGKNMMDSPPTFFQISLSGPPFHRASLPFPLRQKFIPLGVALRTLPRCPYSPFPFRKLLPSFLPPTSNS